MSPPSPLPLDLTVRPAAQRVPAWLVGQWHFVAWLSTPGSRALLLCVEGSARDGRCEVMFQPLRERVHSPGQIEVGVQPAISLALPFSLVPASRWQALVAGPPATVTLTATALAAAHAPMALHLKVDRPPPLAALLLAAVATLCLMVSLVGWGGRPAAPHQGPTTLATPTGIGALPVGALQQPANVQANGEADAQAVEWRTQAAAGQALAPVRVSTPVPVEEVALLAARVVPQAAEAPAVAPPLATLPAVAPPPLQETVPQPTAAPSIADAAPLAATDAAPPNSYQALFERVGAHYGLDWRLLASLAYHESRMNPRALGRDQDAGLMQIVPGTWEQIAPHLGVWDPFDPYSSILAGTYYLDAMRDHFTSQGFPEIYWALAAYNWGPTRLSSLLQRGGQWSDVPVDVQWYVWNILDSATSPTAAWWQSHVQREVGQ